MHSIIIYNKRGDAVQRISFILILIEFFLFCSGNKFSFFFLSKKEQLEFFFLLNFGHSTI